MSGAAGKFGCLDSSDDGDDDEREFFLFGHSRANEESAAWGFIALLKERVHSERATTSAASRAPASTGRKERNRAGIVCFSKEQTEKKTQKNFLVLDALLPLHSRRKRRRRRRQALEKKRSPYPFLSSSYVSPPRSVPGAQSLAAWRGVSGDARGDFEREWSFFDGEGALKFCDGALLCLSPAPLAPRVFYLPILIVMDAHDIADCIAANRKWIKRVLTFVFQFRFLSFAQPSSSTSSSSS